VALEDLSVGAVEAAAFGADVSLTLLAMLGTVTE
jgi:hypothetical protein